MGCKFVISGDVTGNFGGSYGGVLQALPVLEPETPHVAGQLVPDERLPCAVVRSLLKHGILKPRRATLPLGCVFGLSILVSRKPSPLSSPRVP